MTYGFAPTPTVGLPINDSAELFPIRRVYCELDAITVEVT